MTKGQPLKLPLAKVGGRAEGPESRREAVRGLVGSRQQHAADNKHTG